MGLPARPGWYVRRAMDQRADTDRILTIPNVISFLRIALIPVFFALIVDPDTTFWGLVLFPAAVLLLLWGAILPEERYLHDRFGAPYDDYTRRVRRWL